MTLETPGPADANAPSKVIAFKRPNRLSLARYEPIGPDMFPRFRREWNRPDAGPPRIGLVPPPTHA